MPTSPRASLLHSGQNTPFPPSSEYQALMRIAIKAGQERVEAGFKDKECILMYFQIWNLKFVSKLNYFA